MWLLAFPFWLVVEVIYLIRHPRAFSGLAAFVGLAIGGIGYLFLFKGDLPWLGFIMHAIAIWAYYFIKLHK